MALLLHIVIALASLAFSGFLFFKPFADGLKVSAALIAGTILSGTYLVISKPGHLLETCVMGLLFVGISTAVTISVRQKLAAERVRTEHKN